MKNFNLFMFLIVAVLSSCDHRKDLSDAYGNFEAEDVIVTAESTGKLLFFQLEEGMPIGPDSIVGLIDTTQISLQINQLDAQIAAVQSKIGGINAQIGTQNQQKENLKVSLNRVQNLLKSEVATQQQFDDLEGQMKLASKQIEASKTQIVSIQKEIKVLEENKKILLYQLSKCNISSPVKGTVLEKYIRAGEMVVAGKPLFKVADLSSLDLHCYLSGDKLHLIELGKKVKVFIDSGIDTKSELEGVVSWISTEAEFTPKMIQTKEERVKLVYSVKVKVANDGRLKLGMPGEIKIENH